VLVSDNGASGEGGPNGSVNENKFFNGIADTIEANLQYLDVLGSPKTYNHYPTGWAWAFNTPFKMWKRYANYQGGTADPLIVSWPTQITQAGIRRQYTHAIDIVPTIYECLGVELPDVYRGATQIPLEGESFKASFHDAKAKGRQTQFYSMLSTRGIYHDGWKAASVTPATPDAWGEFATQRWELFNTETDPCECHDLAEQEPDKLAELVALWWSEAGKYNALPLESRTAVDILTTERPQLSKPRDQYEYYPGCEEVPESVAVNVRNRSYAIAVDVTIDTPEAAGVLFAHGCRFGGHALYIKDGTLKYDYNYVGEEDQYVESTKPVPTGRCRLSASFEKEGDAMPTTGTLSLYFNQEKVGEAKIKTQPGKFSLAGEGLNVGQDRGEAVTDDYPGDAPWAFVGGTIHKVIVNVSDEPFVDREKEVAAAFARD
jgi:arylsulfatase